MFVVSQKHAHTHTYFPSLAPLPSSDRTSQRRRRNTQIKTIDNSVHTRKAASKYAREGLNPTPSAPTNTADNPAPLTIYIEHKFPNNSPPPPSPRPILDEKVPPRERRGGAGDTAERRYAPPMAAERFAPLGHTTAGVEQKSCGVSTHRAHKKQAQRRPNETARSCTRCPPCRAAGDEKRAEDVDLVPASACVRSRRLRGPS